MNMFDTEKAKQAFVECVGPLTKEKEEWWYTRFGYFISGWCAAIESKEKETVCHCTHCESARAGHYVKGIDDYYREEDAPAQEMAVGVVEQNT